MSIAKKLLIVIPAYNEAKNIERVVNSLKASCPDYDYVVVNDGSNDETASICRKNNFALIDLPVNLGLASGFQTGIKYAYEKGYDYALQFDGDGQHQPQYIDTMLKCMEETNADIVIGSRFVNAKKPKTARMLGSIIIEKAIKLTTGYVIKDPTSGMRLLSRTMLKEFAYHINYGPEPDTISYLLRNGATVKEVQVEMSDRVAGESYLNLKRSIIYMIRMCASIVFIQAFRTRDKNRL